jgi:phosphatidate cytidylyltransferase
LNLLKRILTAVVLIPVVLVLILKAPAALLAAVAALVALLTAQELLKLARAYEIRPFFWPTYVFIAGFFLLLALNPGQKPLSSTGFFAGMAAFAAALAPFFFLVIGMRRSGLREAFAPVMLSGFAFAYVALPLAMLVQLREQWSGAFLLLYLLLVVWAGDIFAYFIGRSVGRHLMAPRVSPKKTWEGAVASLAASVTVGVLLFRYATPLCTWLLNAGLLGRSGGIFRLEPAPLQPIVILSIGVNVAAQLGDLAESLIKRGAGVKDSGSLLPGHGGMLDRIDALLMGAPVLWYYAAWRVLQ